MTRNNKNIDDLLNLSNDNVNTGTIILLVILIPKEKR